MNKGIRVVLMVAFPLVFCGISHAAVIREYQTNFGVMTLTFDGPDVSGSYTHQGGRISGDLKGRAMSCKWSQNNASGSCMASFSDNFERIDLKWNYAGETGWKGDWYGTLIRQSGGSEPAYTHSPGVRVYDTNFGVMTLHFNGPEVSGSYTHHGGAIEGSLDGNTMRCAWKQDNGSGNCVATFTDNFERIDLKWNYSGETGWKGDWYGTLRR